MKYLTLLLLLPLAVYGQKKPKLPTPPNGIWLYDSLFIDATELSNIHWLEYLHYLRLDSPKSVYQAALPDTTVWNAFDTTGVLTSSYLRYPGYRHFGLVGISWDQAVEYCKWRSDIVNEKWRDKDTGEQNFYLTYRLPTEKEWMEAAGYGLDLKEYPYGHKKIHQRPSIKMKLEEIYESLVKSGWDSLSYEKFKSNYKDFLKNGKEPVFNVRKYLFDSLLYSDFLPKDVHISPQNQLGLHTMIGNVAEMVQEKGIAKGGSWAHSLEQSKIINQQSYTKPQAWLGFRCVCEVIDINSVKAQREMTGTPPPDRSNP